MVKPEDGSTEQSLWLSYLDNIVIVLMAVTRTSPDGDP